MNKLLKLLRVVPLLAGSFIGGAIVRLARRLAKRPPRIWHGFTPMFTTAAHVAAGRRAGFPVRSVVRNARLSGYALVRPDEFDVVYEPGSTITDDAHWRCLADLLRHADIWVTHFESLFFRWDQRRMNEWTMRLIRAAGVRTIVMPHGGDVLYKHRFVSRFDWIGRAQLDYPQWDLTAQRAVVEARVSLFCRHAALVFGGDSSLVRLLPRKDLYCPYLTIDSEAVQRVPPQDRPKPRIIHAPNHRNAKGTGELLAALERLEAAGIDFELVLVEKMARQDALALYATADVIADQFIIGGWGMFACEGMMLGKPVLTYLDEEHLGDPVFNMPCVNTNPDNIEQVLAVVLLVPELRTRLGRAGREAVDRYQSIAAMTPFWERIYKHVWWGKPLALEQTAMFDPNRPARAVTENPLDPAFWPVEVGDLMARIEDAVRRIRRA